LLQAARTNIRRLSIPRRLTQKGGSTLPGAPSPLPI